MIQINLLPDIKLEYIKAHRTKRIVLLSAVAIGGVCFGIMVLLFVTVNVFQRKHLSDLNKDITIYTEELKNTPNLDKILTVQNQLNNLSSIHEQKPAATRMFDYVKSVIPVNAGISRFNIDFLQHTASLSGSADNLTTVNILVDTLKFTEFKNLADSTAGQAFSEVVLTGFSRSEKASTFQVTMKFDPIIYDGTKNIALNVPQTITTRSEVEKPEALFQSLTNTIGQ